MLAIASIWINWKTLQSCSLFTDNTNVGVDKKKGEDPSITSFSRVLETERLNATLKDIGESDEAIVAGNDRSQILDWWAPLLNAINLLQTLPSPLFIGLCLEVLGLR
jgi:hypothetical protein